MKYKTKVVVQVYPHIWSRKVDGKIGAGVIVDVIKSNGNYDFIKSPIRGWVQHSALSPIEETVPLPPYDYPNPTGLLLMKTIRGLDKPADYKPEGANYNPSGAGSFDIVWLMDRNKISKPQTIRLNSSIINSILKLNGGNQSAVKWLVSQRGTDKVLSVDDNGRYSCPVPCCSGNNLVHVLEIIGKFARVQTVNSNKPIPETLPPYLLHTWYAFTKGGSYYIPLAVDGGVKYPLLTNGDSAWIQLAGLIE